MLSVIMLSVIMLSVIMLSVIMLSVIMLSVVMLIVVAPGPHHPALVPFKSVAKSLGRISFGRQTFDLLSAGLIHQVVGS